MNPNYKLAKLALQQEVRHVRAIYAFLVVIVVAIIFSFTFRLANSAGEAMAGELREKDIVMTASIEALPVIAVQQTKLISQYYYVQALKEPYLKIAQRFNTYGYTFAFMFPLCSILTAILGFLIAKKGWDNVESYYVKASFLIFFFFSSFFGVLPEVYKTQDNVQNNIAKYSAFSSIQVEIFDLLQDNKHYLENNDRKLDTLISGINEKIKLSQNIFFDLDMDKASGNISVPESTNF